MSRGANQKKGPKSERALKVIAAYNSGTTNFSELARLFQTPTLPLSRSAVSGIIDRGRGNGLVKLAGPGSPPNLRRATYTGTRKPRKTHPWRMNPEAAKAPSPPAPPSAQPKIVPLITVPELPAVSADPAEQRERRRAAFEQMTDSGGCKYPVGQMSDPDFHYCCAPRLKGQPYCPEHRAICWTAAEKHGSSVPKSWLT